MYFCSCDIQCISQGDPQEFSQIIQCLKVDELLHQNQIRFVRIHLDTNDSANNYTGQYGTVNQQNLKWSYLVDLSHCFFTCWITFHIKEFQSVAIGKKCLFLISSVIPDT